MKTSLCMLTCLSLLSIEAAAEVFKCLQNDGSTIYAYVPCTRLPEQSTLLNSSAAGEQNVTTANQNRQTDSQLRMTEIESKISMLQEKISVLQNEQDQEIYSTETANVEPAELYGMQRSIRSRYTYALNKSLQAIADLRRQSSALSLSSKNASRSSQ
ncbi:MAG: hypothetical protein P8R02_15055 [Pseudomonadales bacterium]|nr:hypothetical protein [Pseudomonadales bacterium]